MHLASYVHLLERGSATLASSWRVVAEGHADEPEVVAQAERFAAECEAQSHRLGPARERYGDHSSGPPDRLHVTGLETARGGGLGLLRDLHDVYALAAFLDLAWTIVVQAASGNRDEQLRAIGSSCEEQTAGQLAWLTTQVKTASPQALLVAG